MKKFKVVKRRGRKPSKTASLEGKPPKSLNSSDKTVWTERQLQDLQRELFSIVRKCKKECNTCSTRPCDRVVSLMNSLLHPYALSIFKRYYKKAATCEEMARVVDESVNSVLMDIWGKGNKVKVSFGAVVKWKMVYYLYGNINLFDSEKVQSLDQLVGDAATTSHDDNMVSIIEFCSDTLHQSFYDINSHLYKVNTVDILLNLIVSAMNIFNKHLTARQKYYIYIKCVFAINRFLKGRSVHKFLNDDPKTKYYYTQILDLMKKYLIKFAQ